MKKLAILILVSFLACQNAEDPSLRQLLKTRAPKNLTGKQLYTKHCAACHQDNALGIKGVFPPLKNADYFLADPKRAIHNIIYGQSEQIVVNGISYKGLMPPVKMTDVEVVKVVNYLLNDVNLVKQTINIEDVLWVKQNP